MPTTYECHLCFKQFTHKGTYYRHVAKKNPCNLLKLVKPVVEVVVTLLDTQCCSCLKHFSNKNNRIKHETTSKCFLKKITKEEEKYNKETILLQEQHKQMIEDLKKNMESQMIKNFESNITHPINNQLINLIVDKINIIGELKNIINNKENINDDEQPIPISLEDHQKEIHLKDQKIKLLENAFIKKQKRKDYPEKNVIYMLTTEDNKNKRIYIIGKAKDLKNRLSTYNKTAEHEVVYYKECKNEEDMNIIEGTVLNKLKEYKEQANRDRFILPVENDIIFFTNIIDLCISFYN
jgi:hypothetical protein